jgi:Rap1a immunity proteins
MKRLVLSALLGSLSVAATAQSTTNDTFTAGSLYSACTHNVSDAKTKEDIEFVEQICTGYLRGLTDALFVMQSLANVGQRTCMPKDQAISISEAREVFQTYLRARPQDIVHSAGLVAAMSLVAAYKCP